MNFIDTSKNTCRTLNPRIQPRVEFNPEDSHHCQSLKTFLDTGRWGDAKFVAEFPHVEVPATVINKYIRHTLQSQLCESV